MKKKKHDDNYFGSRTVGSVLRAEKRRDLIGNIFVLGMFDAIFWIMWWQFAPGTPPLPVIPTVAIAIILADRWVVLDEDPSIQDGDDEFAPTDEFETESAK